jgi:hypothetical protein
MTFSSHKSEEEVSQDTIYVEWRCPSTDGEKFASGFHPAGRRATKKRGSGENLLVGYLASKIVATDENR